MEYESKIDITLSNKDSKNVTDSNYLEYLQIWTKSLNEDIESFYESIGDNLFDLDLTIIELSSIIYNLTKWFRFIGNCFVNISNEMISVEGDWPKSVVKIFAICRQIHGYLIWKLDELNRATYGKYLLLYIENISDEITEGIQEANDIIIEFTDGISRVKISSKYIWKEINDLVIRYSRIMHSLKSVIDISKKQPSMKPIFELLIELEMTQVIDRIQEAEEFFNQKRWDKSVHDMRIALELVVTALVRRIQHNSYWKRPMKDGLEILSQNGIITDKFILNHFKVRDVGIHGFLSIKGVHAEGETTENLADSDLEANYCISLAENVIKYLLSSFKQSKFYNQYKQSRNH